jgi:hypothetical protein
MLPAIGALSALSSSGRLGVVVDARPLADQQDGRQLVALQLKTIDRRDAQGQAASRVSGLALVPAEASEKPGSSRRTLALREDRAATAGRLSDRLSAEEREVAERLRDTQLRQEEPSHAAGAGDRAGGPADLHQRGPDGRQDALGGHAGGASGGRAELLRGGAGLAATTTAPTDPPAQDHAAAQLGRRLYAQAGEQAPTRPRLDLTS